VTGTGASPAGRPGGAGAAQAGGPGSAPVHRALNPASLAKPLGYAHAVESAPGRLLFLGGQVGWDRDGRFEAPHDLVRQVDRALENLVAVLEEAGGTPAHVTSLRVYVLSADAWRANAKAIGEVWRRRMGRWFPAMALLEVSRLYEPEALVEIEGTAVLPPA
jgi:enamine deaminase RidA (YjgF/YER057c/UK114 family)